MNVFERKYCIVDQSGNYYTVDELDALVVASDPETAEWFDILEANKRINNSGMSKSLRTVAVNKNMEKKNKKAETEPSDEEFSMDEMDLVKLARELLFLNNHIQKYQNELKERQAAVDEEICDILHFVELYQRDDAQSLELMDKIQECRSRRRRIKDEYYRAETFAKIFHTGGMTNILKEMNRSFEHMDKREYIPRQLHALFVQGTKLDKAAHMEEKEENTYKCEVDNAMEYERRSTIFDDGMTDWAGYVSKQASMFEDMQQYIINLEMDLDDMDYELESLMETCEDAM